MDRSLGFGSNYNQSLSFSLLLLVIITCNSIIQKVRLLILRLLWYLWFLISISLCFAFLFNFHSRYFFTIGVFFVFSLRGLVPLSSNRFSLFYSYSPSFSSYGTRLPSLVFFLLFEWILWLTQVRSPLLLRSLLISFPSVT